MKIALVFVLLVILGVCLVLNIVQQLAVLKELRRRARGGQDRAVYAMLSYGPTLEIFLWLIGGSAAAILFIWASRSSWWLAFLAILAGIVLGNGWRHAELKNWQWRLAVAVAPVVNAIMSLLQPLISPLSQRLKKRRPTSSHTQIYEKEDLIEFTENQGHQADNRISSDDLKLVVGALTFGDKTVGSIMVPYNKVKTVAASASIGPHMMDELHATGFGRFPVAKSGEKEKEIIGTLYLNDIIDKHEGGRVRDFMRHQVSYVNETQSLRQALAASLKTHSHLLIVVNNFEEIVGIITSEDILGAIFGAKIDDDFELYSELRAVAGIDPHKEKETKPQEDS